MNDKRHVVIPLALVLLVLALAGGPSLAQGPTPSGDMSLAPLGTAFTYQGQLKQDGNPVTSTCDFQFGLYDAASLGVQLGVTQTVGSVSVANGLFTVQLNDSGQFGASAFTGDARWLAIAVRCPAGSGTYTTLSPRQTLTAVPYALSLQPGTTIHNKASAGSTSGLVLKSDTGDGLVVSGAGDDGVYVDRAGSPSMVSASPLKNGFEVGGAENHGLYVGRAGFSGVVVDQVGGNGIHVNQADAEGVYVGQAGSEGVYVSQADNYGVYANTTQASHDYGLFTPDNLYSLNSHLAGALMLVAQNGDGGNLEPGDVVAVSGTGAAFVEGEAPAPLVQRASQNSSAVMGVVYRRFVAEEKVEKVEHDGQVERRTHIRAYSTEDPITPGDYLLVVVLGPAQVKVKTASGADIRPGDLLMASPGGQAMKAAPVTVGEVTFYTPSTVIGKAMGALDKAQGSGLVWMLVMPR